MKKIIEEATELERKQKVAEAIDLTMDYIFDMIDNNNIELLNSELAEVNIKEVSIQQMVTILTFTLYVHDRLPYRETFFNLVKEEIIRREGKLRKGLLSGLEGKNAKSARDGLNWIRRNITGEKEIKN